MNEMREPLLQIENLSTHFHMFKGTVKAVDGVSFSLNQGEILGVVGESGSGKSVTSFSIIGLVDEPGEVKADKIIFDGKDLTALSEQDMMKIRGKDISMIFQDPMTSLNPLYTIGKQLEEVLLLHDKQMSKEARARPLCGASENGRRTQRRGAFEGVSAPVQRRYAPSVSLSPLHWRRTRSS